MTVRRVLVAIVLGAFLIGWLVERARDRSLSFPVLPEQRTVDWEDARPARDERTLVGRVVHADGRPAVEASVLWNGPDLSSFTATDSNGRFALHGLPHGPIQLDLLAWEALPTTVRVEADEDDVTLRLRAPRPDLADLPEVRRDDLPGVVIAKGGSKSYAGYEVLLEPADRDATGFDPRYPRRVTCDEQNEFTVPGLVHGAYEVRLLPPWARGGAWPNLQTPVRRIVHPRERVTIVDESGWILGNARTAADEPLAGALVIVHDADRPGHVWPPQETDAQGEYRVDDLPPGVYEVELAAGGALERRTAIEVPIGAAVVVAFDTVEVAVGE